ncbi:MAG: PIN domain-containing protein [Microthrixaceae bacterium]|nr:PIN domain-containing protein [Microthrixaceae bacterium]
MLLDANILLYSIDSDSPFHDAASDWLTRVLRGDRRVALPWSTISAFLRIATHPRIYDRPLTGEGAARFVSDWLDCDPVWIPPTSPRTFRHYRSLCEVHQITGNLVPDALLAATALENGLIVMTTDSDFSRFEEVQSMNPLR